MNNKENRHRLHRYNTGDYKLKQITVDKTLLNANAFPVDTQELTQFVDQIQKMRLKTEKGLKKMQGNKSH